MIYLFNEPIHVVDGCGIRLGRAQIHTVQPFVEANRSYRMIRYRIDIVWVESKGFVRVRNWPGPHPHVLDLDLEQSEAARNLVQSVCNEGDIQALRILFLDELYTEDFGLIADDEIRKLPGWLAETEMPRHISRDITPRLRIW